MLCLTPLSPQAIKILKSPPPPSTKRYGACFTATGAQVLFTAMKTIFLLELLELNCREPLFTDPVVATNLQEFLSSNNTLKVGKYGTNTGTTTSKLTEQQEDFDQVEVFFYIKLFALMQGYTNSW